MSRTSSVLLVWLAVAGWSAGLHLRASLDPPVGHAFVGNFHWIDDFYNYLSYAQQAEDGHLLFRSKRAPHGPDRLVNFEWWLVGTLSRCLGGRPLLAHALLGAVATLALLAFGGGLGGLLF